MSTLPVATPLSRRRMLRLGAAVTGGMMAANTFATRIASAQGSSGDDTTPSKAAQQMIEQIIQAKGKASNGVFSISIERKDIPNVHLHGVPMTPAFIIHGGLDFQSAGGGGDEVVMNADMCLKAHELNPFIHQLIANNITFQAQHQHMYDFDPLVWFVHFRAQGDPNAIATGVKAALKVTSTPFPQTPPANPLTPLPAQQIGQILGAKPSVQAHGVVVYKLPRREQMMLGGTNINPYLNVETHAHFMPYGGGHNAAVIPDFGMIASEVNKVIGQQQKNGWDIGCLYNQETDEKPQLYWSHNFKTGDALQLAQELREAMNLMNLKFM
ncbi:MAG: DUF1259 domain-containing protein [Acidobacteriota bacterium]